MKRDKRINKFNKRNFKEICRKLAALDPDLASILDLYSYPPLWTRKNNFETLVHIILEQQVSLASALAAMNKLRERLGPISPEGLLSLTDADLKACYFSRQKAAYARGLAAAISENRLDLKTLERLPDEEVREKLIEHKGIGHWTVDVYLMFVLGRADIFPTGDLAAVNSLRKLKKLKKEISKDKMLKLTARWKPYRTVAAMMLWHQYLSIRAARNGVRS